MNDHKPICYQYNADRYCPVCAEDDFGRDSAGHITGVDSEGNEVTPLFSWDEWWEPGDATKQTLVCGNGGCELVLDSIDLRTEADRLADSQRAQPGDGWSENPSRFTTDLTGIRETL